MRRELEPDLETWVETNIKDPKGLQPLTPDVALRSSKPENFQGDPADRILVATALMSCQSLVTADDRIISWFQGHPDQRHLCIPQA
jgi:PIN domain nuclease of toxin-antitoxin system